MGPSFMRMGATACVQQGDGAGPSAETEEELLAFLQRHKVDHYHQHILQLVDAGRSKKQLCEPLMPPHDPSQEQQQLQEHEQGQGQDQPQEQEQVQELQPQPQEQKQVQSQEQEQRQEQRQEQEQEQPQEQE
ncbi:hypothetical protein CYMTET_29806 [Cymbomonas tetramitiformis]|uniref:Uncharacterized protein n=1 Tax=Cymbomonas tetramitiformis TaxID=36881 RepID=A0AAE0FK88_9CHLO|nr:hypothetical protein CYMTET_29806 [Cymbomonas tetramitiformis]